MAPLNKVACESSKSTPYWESPFEDRVSDRASSKIETTKSALLSSAWEEFSLENETVITVTVSAIMEIATKISIIVKPLCKFIPLEVRFVFDESAEIFDFLLLTGFIFGLNVIHQRIRGRQHRDGKDTHPDTNDNHQHRLNNGLEIFGFLV